MKKNNLYVFLIIAIIAVAIAGGICFNKKAKAGKLTDENVQEKIGKHLEWFSAAYDGEIYGWPRIYVYKDVTDKVTIPNIERSSYAAIFEIQGITSKEDIKNELAKYVDSSKFNKFEVVDGEDFLGGLTEYNGKVYWINGGIGDAPTINVSSAKVISSEKGISKVKLAIDNPFVETEPYVIVTVEYKNGKFLITDWEEVNE